MQLFNFNQNEIRVIEKNGEPWFVLKDACEVLGLDQVAGVKRRLSDDVISNHPIQDALGRTQDTAIVNEDGLYDVILESRKPEARAFRKWITSDVIPSIRKTGHYSIIQDSYMIDNPIQRAQRWIEEKQELIAAHEELKTKNEQIALQAPKVALYDTAMNAKNNLTMMQVAKSLDIGRNKLFALLREKKVLMLNNLPYQSFIDRGYFEVRQYTITHFTTGLENKTQTMVTPKGMAWIHNILTAKEA